MEKDKRLIQAEEILIELEEPYKVADLIGGFVTILSGCVVLNEVIDNQINLKYSSSATKCE